MTVPRNMVHTLHYSTQQRLQVYSIVHRNKTYPSSMSHQLRLLNLVLCLLLFFIQKTASSSSFPSPSHSLLGAIIDDNDNNKNDNVVVDIRPHDYAVDLNFTNFDAVFRDTPATFAIVEFFANWCPGCRNYKPHYERVARLFNGPDAVHPGIIIMTRVDCALKINTKLCDKFSVDHYPMLFWAPSSKFVLGGWEPKQEKKEIHVIDDARTADRLINWINKQTVSSFGLDDEKFENQLLLSNVSDPLQVV